MPLHRRFRRVPTEKKRIVLLFFLLAMAAAIIAASVLANHPQEEAPSAPVSTAQHLFDYTPVEVASITIRRGAEASWTVTQGADGLLTLAGEDGFPLSEKTSAALLDVASIIACEAVLTEDPADYQDHLADFGLDTPKYEATIAYADGVTAHLRIGNPGTENNAWYYMLVDEDARLFSASRGMVEGLFVSRDSLREVESPVLHKARIDRLTLTGPDAVAQWTLRGHITDPDAADKWLITAPYTYPADASAMATLLANAANIRLGAYVGPATAANLTAFGFDAPRLTIDIHMAAGTIAANGSDGAVTPTDYPESTVTFVIGGAKSDMVDYVLCGDSIYVSSHFTVSMFMDYDAASTMSRYPVQVALGNLAALTIREGDAITEYTLTRTEQVAPNNELITDESGLPIYDVTVQRNGEQVDYTAFETAYNALTLVTVSGTLPGNAALHSAPHTAYAFTDVDGTAHTVELATFDVLHDAVIVDGHAAFYLIKGGFKLKLE